MSDLVRLSMSMDQSLFKRLEKTVGATGAENRSRFIGDLLRTHLANRDVTGGGEVYGTVTIIYDHHARELPRKLVEIQHESKVEILASTHVHLDRHHCLEVIIAQGPAPAFHLFSERFRQLKGVHQVATSLVSAGSVPAAPHSH